MNNVYVYDQELGSRRYQKLLERLETRLTDLGISGKIYRLGPMTRLEDMMREELVKKPKTIVAVGGDALSSRLAGLMTGTTIPLAVVPFGQNMIADAFGVTLENACKVLAARRIVSLDIGRVDNEHSFVCRALITTTNPRLVLDGNLTVTVEGRALIEAINISGDEYGYRGAHPKSDDKRLNICILKTESGILRKEISQSVFVCKQVTIESGAQEVEIDGAHKLHSAHIIDLHPQTLTAIVGRERSF